MPSLVNNKLLELITQSNINPLIVGDFTTLFSSIDRLSGQKLKRETSELISFIKWTKQISTEFFYPNTNQKIIHYDQLGFIPEIHGWSNI